MLEKVTQQQGVSDALFVVSRIHPDTTFECYAYVRGGQHKFTRAGKPFITLYLQDTENVVIPAYIFDIDNFKGAGLELTKVIHSFVKVRVTENYHPRFGMSVIVDQISIVTAPTAEMSVAFLGSVNNVQSVYNQLRDEIAARTGCKITLPYAICTTSYMDFYQGRVGGQCLHYLNMLHLLDVWKTDMNDEEAYQLYVTFVLYVFVHNNYLAAAEKGGDDITLVNTLTASVSNYMKTLKAGAGALEVIHLFFGYTPKDIFVRMVHQASEMMLRTMNELSMFRALPITREGDAGYGTIKRYASEGG